MKSATIISEELQRVMMRPVLLDDIQNATEFLYAFPSQVMLRLTGD